jgi:hypothetical protein
MTDAPGDTEAKERPGNLFAVVRPGLNVVGRLIAITCLVILVSIVVRYWDQLPVIDWTAGSILVCGLVVAFGLVGHGLNVLTWKALMGQREPVTFLQSLSIVGRSQIARYLPGNVFHYVGKAVLAKNQGLSTRWVVTSMVLETVILIVAALLVGGVGYGIAREAWVALAGGGIVVVIVVPILFRLTASHFPSVPEAMDAVGRANLAFSLVCQTTNLLLLGTSAYLFGRFLWPGLFVLGWWDLTWASALAWVCGFVTPGAPGGVGVREGILVGLFSGALGVAAAAALFLALRLAQVLADLLFFVFVVVVDRIR